ncbi:MAG: rRNA adenine N-6-methyltransferase family protein [Saprospiraceae bacterium]|nr:rRNA adenine N-6-methyltransferase family protein [Saprospiraceae bacterium]
MSHLSFLKESIRSIRTTGAVMRSSRWLVREMLEPIDFNKAKIIVELGAGSGAFTKELLSQMLPDTHLVSFEINPQFCKILRGAISDPRFILIEDSATTLPEHLKKLGFGQADYIISGIPFVTLPTVLVHQIVTTAHKSLHKNGLFIQFHYSSLIQKMYQEFFGNVEVRLVPLNIPPAFVMICQKN